MKVIISVLMVYALYPVSLYSQDTPDKKNEQILNLAATNVAAIIEAKGGGFKLERELEQVSNNEIKPVGQAMLTITLPNENAIIVKGPLVAAILEEVFKRNRKRAV